MHSLKQILLFAVAGSRGGPTRARLINILKKKPLNLHKLAKEAELDYKTVQHHLNVLEKNHLVSVINKGSYGAVYTLSEELEQNYKIFEEIWATNLD